MIKVIDINKSFDGKQVLKDISASFEKGKTNLIIGQSGSGKTVLLKSIVGLFEPDSGEILFDTRSFTKMNQKQRKAIRKEIGMVFQGGALFDSATILENVMFPLEMFTDWDYEKKKERVEFCLNRVDLENINDLYPAEISGGMQKRVAIARAIALNPQYLFCDEPNSGLDPKTAKVIDELIQDITYEFNITTIINTHDLNSMVKIGDHIIFIYEGEKKWEGNKTNFLDSGCPELEDFVFSSSILRNRNKD
ncbi:MAG: ATP-binding cassette domain-containing protein [Bacteroidales bacterium]|nr:ATP-binding cassette domain-containing protein [Bacteroidales bacterium]